MKPRLYFDYNASAPLRPDAATAMRAAEERFGNPSSVHAEGRAARAAIESARMAVLRALDAGDARLVWTSGATEADNLAILGRALAIERRGGERRLVTTAIEHSAVLGPARHVETRGWSVERVPPDREGRVDAGALVEAAARGASLLSCILASNEVGTLQDVGAVAARVRTTVHSDASQAVGRLPVSFRSLGVGLLTLSGHKLGGPRGVGALIVRRDVDVDPLLFGGDQESGLRPGTESVAAIVGFSKAVEAAVSEQIVASQRMGAIALRLRRHLEERVPNARVVTPARGALPNTLSVSFPNVDGRALVVALDMAGIAASVGSACASGSIEPSHVLLAMGRSADVARATVRVSWGPSCDEKDADELVARLEGCLASLAKEA